jgi:hypothetical protein
MTPSLLTSNPFGAPNIGFAQPPLAPESYIKIISALSHQLLLQRASNTELKIENTRIVHEGAALADENEELRIKVGELQKKVTQVTRKNDLLRRKAQEQSRPAEEVTGPQKPKRRRTNERSSASSSGLKDREPAQPSQVPALRSIRRTITASSSNTALTSPSPYLLGDSISPPNQSLSFGGNIINNPDPLCSTTVPLDPVNNPPNIDSIPQEPFDGLFFFSNN